MAMRALRSKVSERIVNRVMESTQIPHRPVKIDPAAQSCSFLAGGRGNFCSGQIIPKMDSSSSKASSALATEKLSAVEETCDSSRVKRLEKIAKNFGFYSLGFSGICSMACLYYTAGIFRSVIGSH